MEQWFADKVALVTGGAEGIGRASARLFAQRGAKVVIADIDRRGGNDTADLIRSSDGDAIFVECDVTDPTSVQALICQTVEKYGRLDCAVNNAGITHAGDANWDLDIFERILKVNLFGVTNCLKFELPEILKAGGGAVVNTSSVNGFIATGAIPMPAYVSSKHAVIGLTKVAALQYAKDNVRVNAVCPGVTVTNMVKAVMDYSPESRKTLENFAPMARMARPEEIAECITWLCSDKASFITGHALVIDGGALAG
jgi:NAD(P)-dependent dehydrogenase (short-subunit alcohol dehydrogenase family)